MSTSSNSETNGDLGRQRKTIYLVRHAEAEHNVREKQAIQDSIAQYGTKRISMHERARRNILQRSSSLIDARLSDMGRTQAEETARRARLLFDGSRMTSFRPPTLVLVSPLRRTLETAWIIFGGGGDAPPPDGDIRFVAVRLMREKRTGLVCDEMCPLEKLKSEYPWVDFSDIERSDVPEIPVGEDNEAVRKRAADFLDNYLPRCDGDFIALVGHKAWLRELRTLLKEREDEPGSDLHLEFDISDWHMKLFDNAELRVAQFEWRDDRLVSIVSWSLENEIERETGQLVDGTTLLQEFPN